MERIPFNQGVWAHELSAEERQRVARFWQTADGERFAKTRAMLRRLIAGYARVAPETIQIATSSTGKPYLKTPPPGLDLRFNISHSESFALLGFALGQEVGVDVEYCRHEPDLPSVLATQFTPAELRELEAFVAAGEDRFSAYYRCWSRKEAVVKAVGHGLGIPLKEFSVPTGELKAPAALKMPPGAGLGPAGGSVVVFPIPEISGYSTALAAAETQVAGRTEMLSYTRPHFYSAAGLGW